MRWTCLRDLSVSFKKGFSGGAQNNNSYTVTDAHLFYSACQGPEKDWCVAMATLTLKVSMQPEPGPNLWVFSACYSRFIFTIKKNNNLQKALRGVCWKPWAKGKGAPGAAENNVDMMTFKTLGIRLSAGLDMLYTFIVCTEKLFQDEIKFVAIFFCTTYTRDFLRGFTWTLSIEFSSKFWFVILTSSPKLFQHVSCKWWGTAIHTPKTPCSKYPVTLLKICPRILVGVWEGRSVVRHEVISVACWGRWITHGEWWWGRGRVKKKKKQEKDGHDGCTWVF